MAKKVPACSRFVEAPDIPCSALQWFRDQDLAPDEHMFAWGAALYFSSFGQLQLKADCVSAWNKDPVIGAIGVQTGPQ